MIVLDSNVVIDYFNDKLSESSESRLSKVFATRQYCISIISRIEAQVGIDKDIGRERIELFLEEAACIDIWPEIEIETIRIRKGAKLKLPDAIVAATASYLGATVATNDERFTRVIGLDVWIPERK